MALRGMLVEEGQAAEVDPMFSDARGGLRTRLRTQYSARLGGQWDLDALTEEIGHWMLTTQGLRHRVVHAGYVPDDSDLKEAGHGAELLGAFVSERLASRRYRFPRLALSVLGQAGLERRGLLSSRMSTLVDEVMPTLPAFWSAVSTAGHWGDEP